MKITESGTTHIQEPRAVRIPRSASPKTGSESFNLHDIFYVFYKHKGKIALFALLGLVAGGLMYLNRERLYESTAKILIPYVVDRGEVSDSVTSAYGREGSLMMNSELDLITSWDLAEAVAKDAGPEKIITQKAKDISVTAAAAALMSNLKVEIPKNSTVLHVVYQHSNPEQARSILGKIINQYLIKHKDTHRSTKSFDAVSQKAADAKAVLEADRAKLQNLKKENNIVSLVGKEQALSTQLVTLENDIAATETNLAMQQLRLITAENATKSSGKTQDASQQASGSPGAGEMMEYQSLIKEIESMNQRKRELKLTYAPGSDQVKSVQSVIDAAEKSKTSLVTKYPALASVASHTAVQAGAAPLDVFAERAALASMEAKMQVLKQQKTELDKEINALLEIGAQINRFERDIKEDEIIYTNYNTDLRKSESDHLLKPSEQENISVIQQPSAPSPASSDRIIKLSLGVGAGVFGLGVLLAFLMEMVLDRSIKRPQDVESKINIPLILSVPLISGGKRTPAGLLDKGGRTSGGKSKVAASLPWRNGDLIRPYASAIRDRVGYDFMVSGIAHRPKIIGVTGFAKGAGVSTLARSVASSFAEIANGQVVYVNLNEAAALNLPDESSSELAPGSPLRLVERRGNLSLTTITPRESAGGAEADGEYPQESLSRQLLDLVPQLRSGNSEYVIVDMPDFSPTSPTLGLAKLMDKVLLVIEAGKTDRDLVKRAYVELTAKAHVDVSAVLNKAPNNLPSWAQG
jgi:uncharacterized protein involved in exopolysaccharide biosynthesis